MASIKNYLLSNNKNNNKTLQTVDKISLTDLIKTKALDLGFDKIGIAKLSKFENEETRVQNWLDAGMNAEMDYMKRNFEKRINPTILVEESKSSIVVLHNYFSEKIERNETYKVSQYALGFDYHHVMKEKLNLLLDYIKNIDNNIEGRCFVDSAPIFEKALAKKAGLGWVGKNSCLINKDLGSFFFIGEIFLNVNLDFDDEYNLDFCGTCTKCIDACPTGAIESPYIINANKCISYQTIESKNDIPKDLEGKFQNWIFGCDICQNICPWNNKAVLTKEKKYLKNINIIEKPKDFWNNLSKNEHKSLFKNTPLERTGYQNLKRNIEFLRFKTDK